MDKIKVKVSVKNVYITIYTATTDKFALHYIIDFFDESPVLHD